MTVLTSNTPFLAIAFALLALCQQSSHAASQTWDGGGANANWSTAGNWVGDPAAPGSTGVTTNTDVATFNAAIANTWGLAGSPILIDSTTQNIGGISFDTAADSYFIGTTAGNALKLTSAGTIQILSTLSASNAIETINAPLAIQLANGTYAFSNNSADGAGAGAGTLNFAGAISGGASGATVLTLSGSNTNANTISGIIGNGTATTLAVTKSGAGTWVFGAANIYTGGTTLDGGTLRYTVNNTGVKALTFGLAVGSTNVSTLDLSTTPSNLNATGLTVQTLSASANSINIGSGKTLTVNGSVLVDTSVLSGANGAKVTFNPSGAVATSTFTVTGANTFIVGQNTQTSAVAITRANTLDMRNIATFNAGTSSTAMSSFVLGNYKDTTNNYLALGVNTAYLAPSSTIYATTFGVGLGASAKTPGTSQNTLYLGSGANAIRSTTITVGNVQDSSGNPSATVQWDTGVTGGSLTLAGTGVTSAVANMYVGVKDDTGSAQSGNTGARTTGIVDLTNGTVSGTITNLYVGYHNKTGDSGANSLKTYGTFKIGGGTGGSSSLTITNLNLGYQADVDTKSHWSTGTFQIDGGSVNVGTVNMNNSLNTNAAYSTSNLNINSGTLTVSTALTSGIGTATINLSGGTLNMSSKDIASGASPIDAFNYSSGTLSNAASIYTGAMTATNVSTDNATITLASGKTLSVTGAGGFTLGDDTGVTSTHKLTLTGAGSFAVNNATAIVVVGVAQSSQSWSNTATLDLSDLASVTLGNSTTAINELRVGYGQTVNGQLLLSDTANTINANAVSVAHSNGLNNTGGPTITLGTGTNVIAADTINLGLSKGNGTLKFALQTAGSSGTVTITNQAGSGGAVMVIGSNNLTNTGAGAAGLLDLRGHTATVTASTITLGASTNTSTGSPQGTIWFDAGTFTATTLNMATLSAASGSSNTTGTLNIGGGAFTVGTIDMANKSAAGTGTATGNINVSGGNLTVNTAFTLATRATAGASAGTLTITGGAVTSNVNILDGGGTSSTSKITLNGGTLDLTGHTIGDATNNINTLEFQSGTLQNVATINGTAGLTKTTAGTLTLLGNNSYSGATTISVGTLVVNGSIAGASTSVTGVLRGSGDGTTTGIVANAVTVNSGGVIWPGSSLSGSAVTTGELLTVSSLVMSAGSKLKIAFNATNTQLLAVGGNANISNGTLSLGISNSMTSGSKTILTAGSITGKFGTVILNGTTFSSVAQTSPVTVGNVTITYNATNIVVQVNSAVTPVKVTDFAAVTKGAGVAVSWNAVSEYQNAGYNIYRREMGASDWSLVNAALIAGRITNPDELKYTYFDWAAAGMYEYKLESIDISGGKETYGQFAGPVSLDWNADLSVVAEVDSDSVSAVNDGFVVMAGVRNAQVVSATIAAMKQDAVELYKVVARELTEVASTNSNPNIAARSVASNASSISSSLSVGNVGVRWFSSGRVSASSFSVAKVLYTKPGVMLIPQSSMPDGYDLNNVSLQREGRSMNALAKVPAGLLVFAPGYADDYTDKDAVFIRKTSAPTNVLSAPTSTGLFSSSAPVNVTSPATVTNDYHDVYFDYSSVYRPFSFAPWFSSKYLTQSTTQNFTVNLPQASSGPAKLTINLWSLTSDAEENPDHALQLVINGTVVADTAWDGGSKMMQLSFDVPSGVLNSGDNTVSLVTPTLANVTSQVCFVHSISADYTRLLDGSESFEIVNNSGKAQLYELNNVPPTGAWVVDTRFADRASLVASETLTQADGTLRLRFMASAGGSGKFVVTPVGQENAPISITSRLVKAAKLTGTYLATGPLQFSSGTQPLLTKRSKEGIRGAYFDQEQLFDYYNYGRYGPDGIRNAVRSLKPKYLLLVGRTIYDYRNYEGKNLDPLCPAYLVSTSFWAQTTSDSAFGDLGRGYPEVAVGRLPVNNTSELSGAINHIVNYKGIPQSGTRLHAVADQPDPLTADFGAQLDTIIKAYNPDVTWQENYLARTYQTSPEVTDALKTAANGGADLILYSGHGNAARLGNNAPNILDQTTVQQWTGNTVFLQSTCTANWMAKNVDDYKSIAIQALTQAQGGISASIGTSTYMNSDVATAFMNQLIKNTNQGNARWGNVLMSTQQWAGRQTGNGFYTDLMNTEQLFGDPAMPVFTPKGSATTQNNSAAGTF